MKKLFLLMVAAAVLAPPVAVARDWRGGFGALLQAQGQSMKKDPGPHRGGNGDKRVEHDKREHKGSRLSQEERRDLRRDLDRANREIYRR